MRTLSGQAVPNTDPPGSEYPYGRARNSNPPAARNGTPLLESNLMTDCGYAMLAVMKEAGIIPDESAENIDVSQFKDAVLSLIGTVPNPDKVIIDAPDLDAGNLNLLAKYTEGLSNDDYNTWVGVSEAIGKLTVAGIVLLKVRNFTVGPVVATAGTSVYAGAPGLFSAGFIQTGLGDNTDLQKPENVVGELADDFNFTDTTTYFPVLVTLKGKPMVDFNNFWQQNSVEQFITPTQPGMHVLPLSPEWDLAYIKDLPRLSFTANFVMFELDSAGEVSFYLNVAVNNLLQLVSTNGETGVTLTISDAGAFTISFYDPAGGAGSLLSLTKYWQFRDEGQLLTAASIVLGKSDIARIDGEVWYDSVSGLLQGKQSGVECDIIGIPQGCMSVKSNSTATVIAASGQANKVKFIYFDSLCPSSDIITPSLVTQDITLDLDGVYEIIVANTVNSVSGPATVSAFAFGVFSAGGTVEYDSIHSQRTLQGGGTELGVAPLAGQDYFPGGTVLELYVWRITGNQNIIMSDITFSAKLLRPVTMP